MVGTTRPRSLEDEPEEGGEELNAAETAPAPQPLPRGFAMTPSRTAYLRLQQDSGAWEPLRPTSATENLWTRR